MKIESSSLTLSSAHAALVRRQRRAGATWSSSTAPRSARSPSTTSRRRSRIGTPTIRRWTAWRRAACTSPRRASLASSSRSTSAC